MTTIQDRIIKDWENISAEKNTPMYNWQEQFLRDSIKLVEEETRKEEKGNLEQCMVYLFQKLTNYQKTIRMSMRTKNWLWGSMCSWVDEYIEKLSITNKDEQK